MTRDLEERTVAVLITPTIYEKTCSLGGEVVLCSFERLKIHAKPN